MKQQNRRPLKHSSVKKIQFLKQILIRKLQIIFTHSSAANCFTMKNVKAFFIKVINAHIFKWNRIPVFTSLTQKKISQSRTLQKLFCTASSIMILTFVIHRIRIFFNSDFYDIKPALSNQIHINNQPKSIANFVRNIFHKLLRISNATNRAVITLTNVKHSALSICKPANPFEIFITPRFFVFD